MDQRITKGTLDRPSDKMYSTADGGYRDRRYGRLERPPAEIPPLSNRSSAAYEIPDYCEFFLHISISSIKSQLNR